jgi:hypothetical protein
VIAGVLTLLLYCSFLGLLVIASQCVAMAVLAFTRDPAGDRRADTERPEPRQVAAYVVVAAIACVLFIPWVNFAWERPMIASAAEIATPRTFLRIIKELGDNSYPVSGLLLVGVAVGLRTLWRQGRRQTVTWLLTWATLSIPAVLILELWSGYYFAIRHILHVTPPLVLLAGYGLCYVGERLTILDEMPYRPSAPAYLYAGILALASVWIAQSHWRQEPIDWRGTAAVLQAMARDGDAISIPQVYPLLEYYAPSLEQYRVDDLKPLPEEGRRRIIACYDHLTPDPCKGFRIPAERDKSWKQMHYSGFTIFLQER